MINKIHKLINNKFSRFFKFVFFLRYLFLIFLVAIVLFLSVPHFFDYEKRREVIMSYIFVNYGLEIQKFKDIKYKPFPLPNLEISDAIINSNYNIANFKSKKLIIYPKFFSIYNYSNFQVRKIKLRNSDLEVNPKNIDSLSETIINLEKKIFFKDLNIRIKDKNNDILDLKKIYFSNHGYRKNKIIGEVFNKKFKIDLNDNLKEINFKLLNTGISAKLNIFEKNQISDLQGSFKGKILKSNFRFNFVFDKKKIKIEDLVFRDKDLSFNSSANLELKPFFKIYSISEIKDINSDLLKKLDINILFQSKKFIRSLNSQSNLIFKSGRFSRDFINDLNLETNLAYGRLNLKKSISISDSEIVCTSEVNLLEEFPILYFNCTINSSDKKKLLKKIEINYKTKNETLILDLNGNLNFLSKKINFDSIKINNNFAKKEDLKYFKKAFEKILFDKSFIEIFDVSKIRRFILEIS